jgi:ParB family chromosome partitioning protein
MNETPKSMPKKTTRNVLGRGLEALIPDIQLNDNHVETYIQCRIDNISPNRFQPRIKFTDDSLDELSKSIKEQGIIQPLVVRNDGSGYELVTGERRLRAAKMAGLEKVPVIVKDLTDKDLLEMSIVENIQRENLNPVELADAYFRLINELHITQDNVAKRVGKSRPEVTNHLRIRQLPEQIKADLIDNKLSMGHARALLGAGNSAQQIAAWRQVVSKKMSVRETEALIKRLRSKKIQPIKPDNDSEERYFSDIADDLSRSLGTKVMIKRKGEKGSLQIDFYSDDDLDRLLSFLRNR